jgi:uncharacterized protein
MNDQFQIKKEKQIGIIVAVIIGGLFYISGQYLASKPEQVQQEAAAQRQITVTGRGEVQATPDVVQISLGVQTGAQPTAEMAMKKLSSTFDSVLAAVKSEGIKDEDIKTTNLNINPQYDYNNGKRTLRGFEASENIQVKIRDFGKISDVLGKTVLEGVNQVGGVSFAVDDPDELREEAQEKAIEDARENAKQLSKALDVRLGKVKSFTSNQSGGNAPPVYARAELKVAEDFAGGPPVEAGSQEITSTVTITYELK